MELNPVLRGWSQHKRISWHSEKAFSKLNLILWNNVRAKFVKRRANSTSMRMNYRRIKRGNGWADKEGRILFDPAKVKTIKVLPKKTTLNPYRLDDRPYFERLREKRILSKLREKVYEKFKGKCPICSQSLYNGEKIELHHIQPKKQRGLNSVSNLQPLHRICHIKVTHANNK